jgi:hypothetical protein
MRRIIFALLLLGSRSPAQDWSAIERPLLWIDQGLALIEHSTTGIESYFLTESERLTTERADLLAERSSLESERARLQKDSASLDSRKLALDSRELDLTRRGKSIDEREARLEAVERWRKAAPWVAIVVIGAGYAAGRLAR